ncbi:MAG TPA: hypothetical protein VFC17_13410 [Candidatus Limnocylindrales bacterium]|nr:hypothetical protein [Candidatus Limnocylindrales bacterium]
MGLTVHFKLAAPAGVTEAKAQQLVESMRRVALRFYCEGLVDHVRSITSDAKTLRHFGCDWLILPVPGEENTSTGVEVWPLAGFLFQVDVGEDCEPLQLGLCQYPVKVLFQGKELRTKKRTGWRLASFSKTQYASLHGWEHFQRCHCAVVELLAACRTPELRVKISDEGDYWPVRSLNRLRQNLDQMNGLVAAAAGALKDADEAAEGENRVQSPIFAHRQFERLEAEGAMCVAPALKKLREVIRKL